MPHLIDIESLTIHAGKTPILDQVNLTVSQGETIAITGPSGSGKSTLLRYIAQLHDPSLVTSGRYHYQDKAIQGYDPQTIRQEISYCFQNPTLFGDTVQDNFEFVYAIHQADMDETEIMDLMERLSLDRRLYHQPISELSGGERQRIALIRNLVFPPTILLLDEISSALDSQTRTLVWQYIRDYQAEHQTTIILISHIEDEQAIADRAIPLTKPHTITPNEDSNNTTSSDDVISSDTEITSSLQGEMKEGESTHG